MPEFVVGEAKKILPGKGTVAVLGLAYKKNVDDDRESPSYEIIHLLQKEGFTVKTHDPHVENAERDLTKVLADADLAIIATGHDEYKTAKITCKVLDCQNIGRKDAIILGNGKRK
jgi:UDP-N-acetyl-D-mannosaminuronic acid dehydrogenase